MQDIDKEFVELHKKPKSNPPTPQPGKVTAPQKKKDKPVTKEDVAATADAVVKMDL